MSTTSGLLANRPTAQSVAPGDYYNATDGGWSRSDGNYWAKSGDPTVGTPAALATAEAAVEAGLYDALGAAALKLAIASNLSDVASPIAARDNLSVHGADIASAGTINLDTATGDVVDVTGNNFNITAITLANGKSRIVRFTGNGGQITNGANLMLPGGVNINVVPGDYAIFVGYAASVVRCVLYSPITVTGTGSAVKATSPALVTPDIGAAIGSSLFCAGAIEGLVRTSVKVANYTVGADTAGDYNVVIRCATDAVVFSLPGVSLQSKRVTIINTAADGAALITLTATQGAKIIGGVMATRSAGGANGSYANTKATQKQGDYITLASDNSANTWWIVGGIGVWA